MRKTFVLFACVGVLALALSACGGEAINTGTAVVGNAPVPTSPPAKHFSVGQTVKVGDTWLAQVLSAKTSTGSAIFKPQHAGNVFLVVSLSVKNLSAQEQVISSLMQFHLQDASGQEYQVALYPDAGSMLDGKVEAGSPRKGVLVYEIPKGTKLLSLSFESSIAEQGQTIWDIHL